MAQTPPAPVVAALATCPATLPATPDPKAWTSVNLEHGDHTALMEVMWAPDQARGTIGSVQCHYDTTNVGYWSHPVLTSVFKVRQPDPTAWPSWRRMTVAPDASDRWLCSGATDTAFETQHCPFEVLEAVRAWPVRKPGDAAAPF